MSTASGIASNARSGSRLTALEPLTGLALCGGLVVGWVLQRLVPDPGAAWSVAPDSLPLVAAGLTAAALLPRAPWSELLRLQAALRWIALLLLVWLANGLPFDVLTAAGLIGHRTASGAVVISTVYWPGVVTRACALGAALVVAHLALARSSAERPRPATWYGYVAFVLALPYPVLRLHWAMGGTLGLTSPGAAGEGWEPLLIAVPWVLAAVLSLLLVSPRTGLPRRLLLAAGWSATVIVAMIGPAAVWALISAWITGADNTPAGMAAWVPALFYGSWFLWAIAAAATTRSYQLRTAGPPARVDSPRRPEGPPTAVS